MVINEALTKESKYQEVTERFHQLLWPRQRKVYGLNFASKEYAQTFGQAVHVALKSLCSGNPGMSLLIDLDFGTSASFPNRQKACACEMTSVNLTGNEKAIVILQ